MCANGPHIIHPSRRFIINLLALCQLFPFHYIDTKKIDKLPIVVII